MPEIARRNTIAPAGAAAVARPRLAAGERARLSERRRLPLGMASGRLAALPVEIDGAGSTDGIGLEPVFDIVLQAAVTVISW